MTACVALAADRPTIGLMVAFPAETSPFVLSWFNRETKRMLQAAGVKVVFRDYVDTPSYESLERMVIIRVLGKCMVLQPSKGRHEAALGVTHITDGDVLPFVDLDCPRVLLALGEGGCEARHTMPEVVLGSALARVAAHEIVHVLTGSTQHEEYGLMKRAFNQRDLCHPVAGFSDESIQRLRNGLGRAKRVTAAGLKPPS